MSDSRFRVNGFDDRLFKVVEECGEVLAAVGKTQIYGPFSSNPLLPPEEREFNIDWLKRELEDLKLAISNLEQSIEDEVLSE